MTSPSESARGSQGWRRLVRVPRHFGNPSLFVATVAHLYPQRAPCLARRVSAVMRRMHEAELKAGRQGWLDVRSGRPAVPHGLRLTFRVWAAETGIDRDMAEMALAHAVGSAVGRAYQRSDMAPRRRGLMDAWGKAVRDESARDSVVHLLA